MAVSNKQPFEITDFSGGITDDVFSGRTETNAELNNFLITPDRKILSRPGSTLDDAANSPIPSGYMRIGEIINHARNSVCLVQSGRSVYYRDGDNLNLTGPWATLLGPSGNPPLSVGSTNTNVSHAQWNRHTFLVNDSFTYPAKIYRNENGALQVRTAGLPALSSTPVVTPGATGSQNYLYFFHYIWTYQVGDQTFTDLGPTVEVQVANTADPAATSAVVSGLPVLVNDAQTNYDTSHIQIAVYRTINNGVNAYRLGLVNNGTLTFTDNFSDSAIQTNVQLYTNDGTQDFSPAPLSKYLHVVKNVGFYASTMDEFGTHPNRVCQSVIGNPASVPKAFYVEVEDEIQGIGSVNGLPILFCKKIIYRLDGQLTATGTGTLNPVEIHRSAGCIANGSIVEAENKVFWAGVDGFYASDGYQVFKITDHLNARYKKMLSSSANLSRIRARFDETRRLVLWSVQLNPQSLDQDTLFCLDLKWGVTTTSSFTTWSGQSFRPTAIEIFNSKLVRGDTRGFVFVHDEGVLTDPKVDTVLPPNVWHSETIIWNYLSNQFNFKSSLFRKMVSRILLQAENAGNTTIQITAINDQGKKVRPLKIIRWRRNVSWGAEDLVWGNQDCVWDSTGLIEQWRRMPAGGLRVSYLQIQISNGFGVIGNSDNDGVCTINKSTRTAVLPGLWPRDSVDYYLMFSNDNYTRKFQVVNVNASADTLTLLDPQGLLPNSGSYDWELVGFKKGEPLSLLGLNLHWDNIDQNQNTYAAGDSGTNS